MGSFFECLWPIAEDGYDIEVIPAVGGSGILTSSPERRLIRPLSNKWLHYDPMLPPPEGEPLLFRTFADTVKYDSGAIDFAKRFGVLSAAWGNKDQEENIEDWFSLAATLRRHIEMAEAGIYNTEEWPSAVVNFEENTETSLGLGLTKTDESGLMELRVKLPSLRAALWTQLGLWVSQPEMNQRKCGDCGHWFTFGTGTGRRSNVKYCQRSCANTAHYLKRKGAMP